MSEGSLSGVRIVVTRARGQAENLTRLLTARGALATSLPLLEIAPPTDPAPLARSIQRLHSFRWLVLTSANAVEAFLYRCESDLPKDLQIASIGPATTRALAARAIHPTLEAERSLAEGLIKVLAGRLQRGDRILLPQAEDARPVLAEGLAAAGANVTAVVSYRKQIPNDAPSLARSLFREVPAGWITFTSPSTVKNLRQVLGDDWDRQKPGILAASVGPITTAALRELGIEPAAEADEPGDEGLVEAIVAAVVAGQASGEF